MSKISKPHTAKGKKCRGCGAFVEPPFYQYHFIGGGCKNNEEIGQDMFDTPPVKKKVEPYWTKHRKYEPSTPLGPFILDGSGFTTEYRCPHGIGHEMGIHGCDGCCSRDDFPDKGSKTLPYVDSIKGDGNKPEEKDWKESFIQEFCNDHNGEIRFLRGVFYDEKDGAEKIMRFISRLLLKRDKENNKLATKKIKEAYDQAYHDGYMAGLYDKKKNDKLKGLKG